MPRAVLFTQKSELRFTLQDIPKYEDLKEPENAKSLLAHTAVLKLNGGLGTSMGLDKAKSLLVVKDGKNFLDLIAEQVRAASCAPCLQLCACTTLQCALAAWEGRAHTMPASCLPLESLRWRQRHFRHCIDVCAGFCAPLRTSRQLRSHCTSPSARAESFAALLRPALRHTQPPKQQYQASTARAHHSIVAAGGEDA